MSHMFWNPPARQGFLHTGPFRAVPLRMGGRHLGLQAGPFMGQEAQNRLYSVLIPSIVGRILLATPVEEYFEKLKNKPRGRFAQPDPAVAGTPPEIPAVADADRAQLLAIMENPTSDEIEDLALIDKFFNSAFSTQNQWGVGGVMTTYDLCQGLRNPPRRGGFGRGVRPVNSLLRFLTHVPQQTGRWRQEVPPPQGPDILANTFFCPSETDIPAPISGNYLDWFTANPQGTWGADKIHVQNAITLMKELSSFPFPPPINEAPAAFWSDPKTQAEIAQMSGYDLPLDPEAVRHWITLAVLERYNDIVDRMVAEAKRKAKKKKRKALIKVIALSVAGVVAAIVLPTAIVAIASAIKTAIDVYTTMQQRKEAAKALAESAKLFEKDAPAFAKQAEETAKFVDALAAEQELAAPPTPEMEAAIEEDPTPTSVEDLLVPGAIAAAAAGAAALLL